MFEITESWTWDFWIADTGDEYHLFFLFASKALGEEHRRHRHASVGHAVSTDLVTWSRTVDALVRSDAPAIDDVATWTGCVVKHDGVWRLFYTGTNDDPRPTTQRVTMATSPDLLTWSKAGVAVASADPTWYATALTGPDEPFRDPWVFRAADDRWHMLTTARSTDGSHDDNGIIGHAVSDDLDRWEILAPLTDGGEGFGQLEVCQTLEVEGECYLLFSCLRNELAPWRQRGFGEGGVWIARAETLLGPFDLAGARLITDDSRYAGRAIRDRSGDWQFLAFENVVDGEFVGRLADPEPLVPLIARAFSGADRNAERDVMKS